MTQPMLASDPALSSKPKGMCRLHKDTSTKKYTFETKIGNYLNKRKNMFKTIEQEEKNHWEKTLTKQRQIIYLIKNSNQW